MKHFVLIGICLLTAHFVCEGQAQPGDDFNAMTAIAASALQRWYNSKGLWNTTGWWNAPNCIEAIENVIVAENGGQYLKVLSKTFDDNSRGNFLNEYYDDEGWWALAWIRAFDLTGERRYLDMSKTIFVDMAGGWDSHCDGGIWWRKDRRYKNAIANELFLLVAIRLHQRTPDDNGTNSYLNWATRECAWFNQSGMINSQHLVNDGLNRRCENNGRTTWSYNQGVIVGGLTELYKTTGDTNYLNEAASIADATIARLNDGKGILREPCEPYGCEGGDVPQFKGIFVQNLADLYDLTHNPAYYRFLVSNARSIWTNDRDSSNRFGLRWDGPVDSVDAARQSSAMMPISVLAEPSTAELGFARGSGDWTAVNPGHEVGQVDGKNAWCADPVRNSASGFLTKGVNARSLPAGSHEVAFELKVDNFDWDDSKVATLSVVDAKSEQIVASRDVARNEFPTTLYQSMILKFNAAAGRRYHFRTFWYFAPHAPRLTQRSVMVK